MNKLKVKCIIIILMFLLCAYLAHYKINNNNTTQPIEDTISTYVQVSVDNQIEMIEINEYLLGVVVGEMPLSFELEALKAQVVASRTYVYARNLQVDNTTSSQVFLNKEQRIERLGNDYIALENKVKDAILQTEGEVLFYDGQYISALFFSSSGGYTQNNDEYFNGTPVAYLRSVESLGEQSINKNYNNTYTFTNEQIKNIFDISGDLSIISYNTSGSVETLCISNQYYTGREVREKLGLASNYFTIEKISNGYTFTTSGSGHGVGMSQYGAQYMALQGENYQTILCHYYSDVEIIKK